MLGKIVRPEAPGERPEAIPPLVAAITERMLRLELGKALRELGPQKTSQIVVNVFRLNGLPKELRRHI